MASGYVKEIHPVVEGYKGQANYELQMKAHLVMFLKENSM
jgi:hypothetical protein